MDLTNGVLIAISGVLVLGSMSVLIFQLICNRIRDEPAIFEENLQDWK
jgi:hypothetical protein